MHCQRYDLRRADGPSRHPHSRRRDRAGAHRSDASRPRGDRGRARMGRAPGRRGRDGRGGHTPTRGDARVGEGERRGPEGADHHADRHRLPLGQRRAAPRARVVCLPAPVQVVRRGALAVRGCRPRHRAREHGGPLRGHRVRSRHRRRGARDRDPERPAAEADRRRLGHLREAHQRRRVGADHPFRVRVRARARASSGRRRDEGEHHEVHGRALSLRLPRGRGRLSGRRVARGARRRAHDAARPAARGVRRPRAAEPLRRHHQRPHRRASSAASGSRRARTSASTLPSSRRPMDRRRSTRGRTR